MAAADAQIQIKARKALQLFPRPPQMIGGEAGTDYGIIRWRILESYAGDPVTDRRRETIIKGTYGFDPLEGKEYNILARSTYHPKYGHQYELVSIEEENSPPEIQAVYRKRQNERAFLSTFLTRNQIDEMYAALDDPIAVLSSHDLEALKKVRGIGDFIAPRILERFDSNKDVALVYLRIGDVGLSPAFVRRLISRYGNVQALIEQVCSAPYQLVKDVHGIGFERADRIALRVGIGEKSPQRVLAFFVHTLEEESQRGNSWIRLADLTARIYEAFDGAENILEEYEMPDADGSRNNFQAALHTGLEEKLLAVDWSEKRDGSSRIYLQRIKELERAVAKELIRLAEASDDAEKDGWEERIAQLEKQRGWQFTEEQRSGILLGLNEMVCLITGGAGTGKSSLVAGILAALPQKKFVQTALSGKAAARLEETTGERGSTIHRLLGYDPDNGFEHTEENPIDADIVILDEISLVGGEIFLALLKAMKTGTKLIILGDMGQLEAIGCMNIAHDLLLAPEIPTVELKTIHRQAQRSGITLAASRIREHRSPVFRNFEGEAVLGELRDMHILLFEDAERIMDAALMQFRTLFSSPLVAGNIMNIQVLSPLRDRGDISVNKMNRALQAIVNPDAASVLGSRRIYTGRGDEYWVLSPGDKVMCIRNNYQLKNAEGKKSFAFNGWLGVVRRTTHEEVHVEFPHIHDTVVFPAAGVREDLMLGYACTIHKYQGSSAPVVIGVMDYTTPPQMRTTELLYTLLTRAEKECILIGQNEAVDDAVRTSFVSGKHTFLPGLLAEEAANAARQIRLPE